MESNNYDSPPSGGACRGTDRAMWFPEKISGGISNEMRATLANNEIKAKAICSACPVIVHCAEYSIRHEPFGLWAGMTEIERAEIRQERYEKEIGIRA